MVTSRERDSFTVGIITISDRGARGEREDLSGKAIQEMVPRIGGEVRAYVVIPDERDLIAETIVAMVDRDDLDVVLTTGGTGLGPRDVTPQATRSVVDYEVPGLAEAMRMESLKKTPMAMLSRAVAGVRGRSLVVNLPGSPKGVRECLEVVAPALRHAVEILRGDVGEHQ
ncbi:MAG TPA: MogA/MoaB family molybdenum cofactor biosynthesis protein [Chloroflexota bacterium]